MLLQARAPVCDPLFLSDCAYTHMLGKRSVISESTSSSISHCSCLTSEGRGALVCSMGSGTEDPTEPSSGTAGSGGVSSMLQLYQQRVQCRSANASSSPASERSSHTAKIIAGHKFPHKQKLLVFSIFSPICCFYFPFVFYSYNQLQNVSSQAALSMSTY